MISSSPEVREHHGQSVALLSSLAPHVLQPWTHPREPGLGGPSWDGRVVPRFGQDTSYKSCVACQLPWKCSCSHHSPASTQLASSFCVLGSEQEGQALPVPPPGTWKPSGVVLLAPACLGIAQAGLCAVETSAALCCHALNLFIYELLFFISICAATGVARVQIRPV